MIGRFGGGLGNGTDVPGGEDWCLGLEMGAFGLEIVEISRRAWRVSI